MKRKPRRAELGLSVEDYDRLLAAQGGRCALCPSEPKTRRLDVDHDHKTGTVRGLLCHRCNRALPTWVTPAWLARAAAYLYRHDPDYQANYATGVAAAQAKREREQARG